MKAQVRLVNGIVVTVMGDTTREIVDLLLLLGEGAVSESDEDDDEVPSAPPVVTAAPVSLPPRAIAAPAAKPKAGAQACRRCGFGYWQKEHREKCSQPRDKAKAETKKQRRSLFVNGVKLDEGEADPDYSAHGEMHALPSMTFDGPEGERIVKEPKGYGQSHAHTFRIPPANGYVESLGRCSCGETRRYRNEEAVPA